MEPGPYDVAVPPRPAAQRPMTYRMIVCGLSSLLTVPFAILVELKLLAILKRRLVFSEHTVEAMVLLLAAAGGAFVPFALWGRRDANAAEPTWAYAIGVAALSAMALLTAVSVFYVWLFGGAS